MILLHGGKRIKKKENMVAKTTVKKYYFVLRNIDPIEIDAKYCFFIPDSMIAATDSTASINTTTTLTSMNTTSLISHLPLIEESSIHGKTIPSASITGRMEHQRTRITDLSSKNMKEQHTFSYLDESKKDHTCIVTMIHHLDHKKIPERVATACFWCRHAFENHPIGCPLQYIPNRIVKNYYSEITKDNYTLRENISLQQFKENEEVYQKYKMDIQDRDFYITDGIFCSFNCCLSFIYQNHQNPLYSSSENILVHLYTSIFGNQAQPIVPAPSWRLLRSYGGHLSIEDYRKNFYNIEYKDVDNIIMPRFRSIGVVFEKQVRI